MESFHSANCINSAPHTLSPDLILPEETRPSLSDVSHDPSSNIPIINFTHKPSDPIREISRACEQYGFFQIINHGVPAQLSETTLDSVAGFFESSPEVKAKFNLLNFHLNGRDGKIRMWSETLSHPWHSLDETIHLLPDHPIEYREVFPRYAKEIGELMSRLLSLISEGLGLEKDWLRNILGDKPSLRAHANHNPPCPEPELTLGMAVHTDPHALTVLRQREEGLLGLQVMIKDGKWVAVNPLRDAFVVNLGDQIEVQSNGRYKSVHHRAVTTKNQSRVSLAMFYAPNLDAVIGPVEDLIDGQHPKVYREYLYSEFLAEFGKQEGMWIVKEVFSVVN